MISKLANQRNRKNKNQIAEVSLTPLIDTALVLLVIFMVSTPMMHNAIKVDLPYGAKKEDNNSKQEISISIDSAEQIFLNGDPVSFSELINKLKFLVQNKNNQKVFVYGDKAISYGSLISIVDNIKQLPEIEHVILSTQKA